MAKKEMETKAEREARHERMRTAPARMRAIVAQTERRRAVRRRSLGESES